MNCKDLFFQIYYDFLSTDMHKDMLLTKEDSPWHREENVWEHTRMCLSWYDRNLASKRTPFQQFITNVAILFHDTGKPAARTEKFSETRGQYFAYPGHEQISAMLFMNYVAEKKASNFKPIADLSLQDVSCIRFMIQCHLPYEYNSEKLKNVKKHLYANYQNEMSYSCFTDAIMSDAHGRISDDMESKLEKVDKWVAGFNDIEIEHVENNGVKENQPIMYVMIGASGNGKSSFIEKSKTQNDVHFGLDLMREEFYIQEVGEEGTYSDYFNFACESKTFNQFAQNEFNKIIKLNKNIFLDNTNTSMKSRRKWIHEAQRHNYYVIGVELISPLSVLVERQSTRGDKNVPEHSVSRQYLNCAMPFVHSEVDEYILILNNEY